MTDPFISALVAATAPERVLTEAADCLSYGYDNSRLQAMPRAVVFPLSHEEVASTVALCNEHEVPLVPRGRGTGTTGATVPLDQALVMSLERMDQILRMDPDNRLMVVQPGVTNERVQQAAAEHDFFWPPDPTSAAVCTVGGNLAYNSAGPRAVKYGTPRENTLGLRAVTGGGASLRTGVQTTKGVVGYDLTRLLIGSEGTLAVITEATLKLTPLQPARRTLQAVYRDMAGAARAVSRIMAQPVIPYAVEFIDHRAIEMVRDYSRARLPEHAGAMLMIEVDGPLDSVDAAASAVGQAARNESLVELITARSEDEVKELWATRKALSPALRKVAPKKINEDVVVPVSRMAELIDGLNGLSERFQIPIVNFGHAANGNIHVNLLVDPDDTRQMTDAEQCLDRVFALVLGLGGTLSGEHGIGLVKRDFVSREVEANALALMRGIKREFDPRNLLNPGKGFPD
jgi:D-lactate dehydrogenase